jgi:hypothetical protein
VTVYDGYLSLVRSNPRPLHAGWEQENNMESSLACSIYLAAQKNMATYTCSLEISCVQATYSLNASLKEIQKIYRGNNISAACPN